MATRGERTARLIPTALSRRIKGRVVAGVEQVESGALAIRFEDGGCLTINQDESGIGVVLEEREPPSGGGGPRPTRRQREYLEFIRMYMHRNGVSPAEADIQTHFLVSAPSVNQMVRTLERRGFIARDHDWAGQAVPRSIRVLWDG